MRELVIAFGLFLFIEGILYALFPAKMKSMLKKLELVKNSQLRSGGLIFNILFIFAGNKAYKIPSINKKRPKAITSSRI